MGEVAQHPRATFGMNHFRVELHTVEPSRFIGHGGQWSIRAFRDNIKAVGQIADTVAMAHPDLFAVREAGEQRRVRDFFKVSAAKFLFV